MTSGRPESSRPRRRQARTRRRPTNSSRLRAGRSDAAVTAVVQSPADEGQELVTRRRILAQNSEERCCGRARAPCLYSAERHAEMLRLEQDSDAAGRERVVQRAGNLRRETL